MLCRTDLGSGRVTGEVIRYNEGDKTITMRLLAQSTGFIPRDKEGKAIKRHIDKHHVVFQEVDDSP